MAANVTVFFCMMAGSRLKTTKANLDRVHPWVDHIIFVHGGDDDGTMAYLQSLPNCVIVERLWDDKFTFQRNSYLQRVGELADGPSLVCVADDDEVYSQTLLRSLREIGRHAWEEDLNTLCIRVKDTTVNRKGEVLDSRLGEWYKPLVYVYEPGMHYIGVGQSEVHEQMMMPSGTRAVRLGVNPESDIHYEHIKELHVIWPRAVRNFFAGGGGMNLGDSQPLWKPFREMVSRLTGIERSPDFLKYLEAGNIHQDIKDWFIRYRFEGTSEFGDHEGRKDGYDGSSEVREGFLAYFIYFHPEELDSRLIEEDRKRGYKDYLHEIERIHGKEMLPRVGIAV